MTENNTKKFLEVVFDPGDYACFGHNKYANKTYDAKKTGLKEEAIFMSINAFEKGSTRAIDNVTKFRTFLFEIDEDREGNKVPAQIQTNIVRASGLPWSTCTFSGNKSLHWLVVLDKPLEDRFEYSVWWKTIYGVLNQTAADLGYDLKFDAQVKDPSRFTRAPGAIRMETKKIQEVGQVRTRVSKEAVREWFESKGHSIEDYMPKPNIEHINAINLDVDNDERIKYVEGVIMKNMEYVQGSKNGYQFTLARALRATGMDEHSVRSYIVNQYGEEDYRKPVSSAFSSKYDSDEKIYVYSKEERRAYAVKQDLLDKVESQKQLEAAGKANEVFDINGVADYIRVGTHYFKIVNGELLKWNADTLKADFGTSVTQSWPKEQKYNKFCNVIDYIDPKKRIGTSYNMFIKPDWNPEPGEWPTTRILLERVFSRKGEDQFEEGLDWIQKAIIDPRHTLHSLVLTSRSRETGKDTFMDWLQALCGRHNVFIGDIQEFINPFNAQFASKHFICLNELKVTSLDKSAIEKLKAYVTQKTVNYHEKQQTPVNIDYYGKIVLATNNVDDFMDIDDEENRFWLREMPILDKKGKDFDPEFVDKLINEIPHFLHFILNREMKYTEKQGRFWLPDSVADNSLVKKVKSNSKSKLYYEIKSILDMTANEIDDRFIYFISEDIRINLPDKWRGTALKDIVSCLEKEFKLENKKAKRVNSFSNIEKNTHYWVMENPRVSGPEVIEVSLPY